MKMRSVGAELFHSNKETDGRTDWKADRRDDANSRFANAPKNALKFYSPVTFIREYWNKEQK
jgi:hypothetical protein